jgi:hypothetical protein
VRRGTVRQASEWGVPTYRERLWPSVPVFLATALLIPGSLLVVMPIDVTAAAVTCVVLTGGAVALLLATSPVVAVDAEGVRAGRALLDAAHVGAATAHVDDDAVAERGVRLDARAWVLFRGWVRPVVRIEVDDDADPTPYWVVSTRDPDAVVAAITALRAAR